MFKLEGQIQGDTDRMVAPQAGRRVGRHTIVSDGGIDSELVTATRAWCSERLVVAVTDLMGYNGKGATVSILFAPAR